MDLTGVIPPILTPVENREGELNTEAMRTLTETLVEAGVHGLFPCGTNGEFSSLSRGTRRDVIDTVSEAAGETPVLAGCGDTSIRRARTLILDADDAGADAAVVVTPYYLTASQDGLCEYYRRLAGKSSLPIIIYDIPSRTGEQLTPASVTRLAQHKNIIGIKDSSGDLSRFYQLLIQTPDTFDVFQGSTAYAPQSLDMGADGFVSGGANVFPSVFRDVFDTWDGGDRRRSLALLKDIVFPLVETIMMFPSIPTTKYLTTLAGHDMGPPVVPLPELTEEQKTTIEKRYLELSQGVE